MTRKSSVLVGGKLAAFFEQLEGGKYRLTYVDAYQGAPISLCMPIANRVYEFSSFPAFFDGLLPEGFQLEALLRIHKIDRSDYFTQLVTVGRDLVGHVSVEEIK